MSLENGTRLGPYEILSPLGAGGMGEVYRARDSRLGRDVAIKVLPAELSGDAGRLKRFEKEARAASALNHPNIVTIYEVGSEGGPSYIAMELVAGKTLREILLAGPLPTKRLMQLAASLSEGLAAAHEVGIVHRDLKPENIMVAKEGFLKILDFGLAKLLPSVGSGESNLPTVSRTEPGGLLGTVGYMSPEQAAGQPVNFRSDQFSLGAILYEMATGKRAFQRVTAVDTLSAILHDELAPVAATRPDCPMPLSWLIERCLSKDPAGRYESTRDLAKDLFLLRDRASSASLAGLAAGPLPRAPALRAAVPWIVASLGMLAAGILATVHSRERPAARRPVRFSVPLPEQANVINGGAFVEWNSLAVSPDGSRLAFTAATEGETRIWVRSLDALTAIPIAGTGGARSPFWSPDGEHLAFFSDGKLKRIPLSGGLAQTLCDVASMFVQGSWGRARTILFAQGGIFDRGLYEVSDAGGAPRLISGEKSWQGFGGYRWPRFLSDGRRFLCLASDLKNGDGKYLLAGELGSHDPRRVAPLDSRFDLTERGDLFYVREGTLVAQPFDPAAFRLAGAVNPVAERIPFFSGTGWAPFSVSQSGVLAYQASPKPVPLQWVDRNGHPLGAAGPPGQFLGLRLSTDGRRVAVEQVDPASGFPSLWITDLARNVASRLTSTGSLERSAVWSPDGSTVVFGDHASLRAKRPDATGDAEVFPPGGEEMYPSDWSSDGRLFLYAHNDEEAKRTEFWLMPLSGDRKPTLFRRARWQGATGQLGGAAFSPDSRWIAFASDESGRAEIYVAPVHGPGQWKISTDGAANQPPRWRRDGKELFYVAADHRLMSVPIALGADAPEIGASVPLFWFESGVENSYDVAPDGQRFLIASLRPSPITVVLDWAAGLRR